MIILGELLVAGRLELVETKNWNFFEVRFFDQMSGCNVEFSVIPISEAKREKKIRQNS